MRKEDGGIPGLQASPSAQSRDGQEPVQPAQHSAGDGGQTLPYERVGDYGFTSNPAHLLAAQQWRDAAVADGWEIQPTYGDHEGVERAAKLRREGYVVQILTRDNAARKAATGARHSFEASISIWGPDGLHIKTPAFYSWEAIKAAAERCDNCGARGPTQRYSFAGRSCAACLPHMRALYERGNWTA